MNTYIILLPDNEEIEFRGYGEALDEAKNLLSSGDVDNLEIRDKTDNYRLVTKGTVTDYDFEEERFDYSFSGIKTTRYEGGGGEGSHEHSPPILPQVPLSRR